MKKFKIISIIVLILVLGIGVYFFFFAVYSSGYRVGTIIKMSERGVVFKTIEGQLHTGGVTAVGEGGLASTIWSFSVERGSDEILDKISKAADDQKRVKLFYQEKFYQWAFFGDTKYFIREVEILESKTEAKPLIEKKTEPDLESEADQPSDENTLF
ncbi:MAG: hypothetical protein ACJASM_002310 [Salibacteraceae bacterium]|jgi:hypothetical protein